MSKNLHLKAALLAMLMASLPLLAAEAGEDDSDEDGDGCYGEFPNPFSDVCWDCIFPISIGSAKIEGSNNVNDSGEDPPLICVCPAPPPVFYRIGVGVGFWEPFHVSEVVREPMCSPVLDGSKLGDSDAPRGTNGDNTDGGNDEAFYQVHLFQYPLLSWVVGELIQDLCQYSDDDMDLMYLTELDSQWNNDDLTFVMNPEAVLFASLPAQLACVADSTTAAAVDFGIDSLFWCSGSQGSVFPIDGAAHNHTGGVDSSLLLTHRLAYKSHRVGMLNETGTTDAMCSGSEYAPIMRKGQYKQTMLWPVPNTRKAYGFGAPSTIWASGREYPVTGEDFVYLLWRKRLCCAG